MNVETTQHGDVVLIAIEGTIDTLTADEISTHFEEQIAGGHTRLVVDLTDVDYLASTGLRLLLTIMNQVREKGGDLKLLEPNENVRRIMDLTGIFTLIDVHPDAESAIESYSD